jgi:hypothetical protein
VGQLGQGVGLVHELRKLRRAEELLDGRHNGSDVDQHLRGDRLDILHRHAFANHPLQAQQADPELILQQLADTADAAIAQVVDVVRADRNLEGLGSPRPDPQHAAVGHQLQALGQDRVVIGPLETVRLHQGHHVADRSDDVLLGQDRRIGDALLAIGALRHAGHLQGAAVRAGDLPAQLAGQAVAAHPGQVVALGLEEEVVEQLAGALHRRRVAGALFAVDLNQRFFSRLEGILLQGRLQHRVGVEKVANLLIGFETQGTDQHRRRNLASFVDADVDHVRGVGLELQPGPAVGDDHGRPGLAPGVLVDVVLVVDARRAHELADDDPLGPVDHEGALLGHRGEISHEDFLFLDLLDLAPLLGDQADLDLEGTSVGRVAIPALGASREWSRNCSTRFPVKSSIGEMSWKVSRIPSSRKRS